MLTDRINQPISETYWIFIFIFCIKNRFYQKHFINKIAPGQRLAPVFVTALTKITIFFDFLVPLLRPRFGTLKMSKRAKAGAQRMEVFQKAE
jgi:hypothetical protein